MLLHDGHSFPLSKRLPPMPAAGLVSRSRRIRPWAAVSAETDTSLALRDLKVVYGATDGFLTTKLYATVSVQQAVAGRAEDGDLLPAEPCD